MPLLLLAALPAWAQPLAGTYSIGGATADYNTLADAITYINNWGISGPVVFEILPGTYTGTDAQGSIDNLSGSSPTNTVTFRPRNGRGTVELNPTGTSSTNYVFQLSNSNYVIIEDLTLNNTGGTYGADVAFTGTSSYNTVTRCLLKGSTSGTSSRRKSRIFADGLSGTGNVIAEDSIINGSYSIYWNGDGSASAARFENNTMVEPYRGGVYLASSNDDQILNNTIITDDASISPDDFSGFWNEYTNGTQIIGNSLESPYVSTYYYYPFYMYECNTQGTNKMLVRENTFNVSTYGYFTGFEVYYSTNYDISQNTVNMYNDNWYPQSNGLYVYNYPGGTTYGNNTKIDSNSFNIETPNYGYIYFQASYYGRNHSFSGNNVSINTTGSISQFYANGDYVDKAKVSDNTINLQSSWDSYPYMSGYSSDSVVMEHNDFSLTTSDWYSYAYMYVFDYARENKIRNNKFAVESGNNGGAIIMATGSSSGANSLTNNEFSGNTFKSVGNGSAWGYGLQTYSCNNDKVFNNVIVGKGTGSSSQVYGLYVDAWSGKYDIYNNTIARIASTSTSSWVSAFEIYAGTQPVNINNNIIYNESAGARAASIYDNGGLGVNVKMDYNNIYSTSSTLVYDNWTGSSYSDLTAWRAAGNMDKNSISYDPGFTNVAGDDFTPDPTNQNSWSVNGRGIHIANNNIDKDGNPRVTTTGTGVPDLGAYEFVPDASNIPPLCTVVPATPTAGGTQVYTLGRDTVATIKWDAAATVPATAPDVRQYTGTVPPGLGALNPTNMYFYTDISSSTSADFETNIYYKEPWMGTISSEAALHLAQQEGANPWVGYPITISGSNTLRNYIYSPATPKLNTYGKFTGIDVANNAGTAEVVTPTGLFCAGTYPVTVRIKNTGNNVLNSVKIYWEINGTPAAGSPITYTTPIPVNNGVLNFNSAVINLGNVTFGAAANNFKIWTSEPNGVTDIVTADDTLRKTLRASLSGTYTVGGTSPDFPDVEAAVEDLNTYGVCGPVIFNIRPGTYTSTKGLVVNPVQGGGNAANRVTFQSENGSASSVVLSYASTNWDRNYTFKLSSASYITLKNITIAATGGNYAAALMYEGNTTNDSLVGCVLTTGISTNYYFRAFDGMSMGGGNNENLVFQNNTFTGGSYGFYLQGDWSQFCMNAVIENNIFDRSGYNYVYYSLNFKFNNNTIIGNNNSYYGMYFYNAWNTAPFAGTFEAKNNKVTGITQGYGLSFDYPNGYNITPGSDRSIIANNAVSIGGTAWANYGIYVNQPSNVDIISNSINVTNTNSSCYAMYINTYGYPYENNVVKNNAFINTGGGYAYYLGMYDGVSDYNNVYATGTSKYSGFYGTFNNFPAFRAALASNGWEQNSISYSPGFTSATDLRPDPTNAASWSLNGRGEQLAVNSLDMDGNNRPVTLADGVPDIGAYEFEPTVAPPAAVATPALAAPGVPQVFTFGDQKVATVRWNTAMALTTPLTVRQYSGRIPPANFTTISGGTHQYFYTDMIPSSVGTTYDFDLTLNYMDIWMGNMPSEPDMKLAHKYGAAPWISYNEANSITNDATNEITAAGVTSFGTFTGIEDGINFSAVIKLAGKHVICAGDTAVLTATPVSGGSTTYQYEWYRNGSVISGATSDTYLATAGGDYTVKVTGTQSTVSLPVTVTVTAAPMANIAANSTLIYCTGNGLELKAASAAGIISYQWQLNGVDIPGATNSTYTVDAAGNYSLIVSNVGCSDTASTIVNAGPIAVNLGNDFSTCETKNKSLILDAGYPGAKYTWSTGDTTQTIEITKSGTYSVQVDAGPNCVGTDAINVTVNPLPTATGISKTRINNTYTFGVAGSKDVTRVLWLFSDGTTHTANTVTKTYDGNLFVTLVIFNDCGSDTIEMVEWATNVPTTENDALEASLYPNPANEQTLLSVTGAKIEEVTILNSLGQVVYRTTLSEKANKVELPVSTFASGRYIVRATTTEGIISKPLNIQR